MSTTFRNETVLTLDGRRFRNWTGIRFSSAVDNLSTVEVVGPFDPTDEGQRKSFRPFDFQPISVAINDQIQFSGTIKPSVTDLSPTENTFTVGAYSLPGVLGDCPAPAAALPLEFKNQNLHEIAKSLAALFDLEIRADVEPGSVFKKLAIKPGEKILPWLAELAKSRAQIISNTRDGRMLFHRAISSGSPVAILTQGQSPLIRVQPRFKFSEYYSEITGIQPVKVRAKKSTKFTVKNSLLESALRPHVYKVPNGKGADLEPSVRFKMGLMFANMVTYTVEVATWRDRSGNLWEPNTILRLTAPGARIYKPFDFVIRTVTLAKEPKSETAILELMLPGSFTMDQPGGFPWDD